MAGNLYPRVWLGRCGAGATVMNEECVMCNCKRTINVQICLSSERDVSLLKELLTLLKRYNKEDKSAVLPANCMVLHDPAADRNSDSITDHDTSDTFGDENPRHSQPKNHKPLSQASTESDVSLEPNHFLNDSELALLTTPTANGKNLHKASHRKVSISDLWREPKSLSQDTDQSTLKLSPSSVYWLKTSPSHNIQEWLARKEREHQNQKKRERIAKKLAEEEMTQKSLSASEKLQRARASYQQWLRKKRGTVHVSPGAKSGDQLEETSVITVGFHPTQCAKAPNSPQHRVKRGITFEEWAATKSCRKLKESKSSPVLNHSNEDKKSNSFKKAITYESWLKSKLETGRKRNHFPMKTAEWQWRMGDVGSQTNDGRLQSHAFTQSSPRRGKTRA